LTTEQKTLRVALAGGGTGGHIIPALALAEGLKQAVAASDHFANVEFRFYGSHYGMETQLIPDAGYAFEPLHIRGLQRSISLTNVMINLRLPFQIMGSVVQANHSLKKYAPHLTIGTGGYASAIPVRQSIKQRIPVFLQEQNSYPGLTTRLFADKAVTVFLTYAEAENYLKDAHTQVTGNPVRAFSGRVERNRAADAFNLVADRPTLLIVGGSQGARVLNRHFEARLNHYLDSMNIQVLWQTGRGEYERYANRFESNPRVTVMPFIKEMHLAYSLADLVICRAGAMTLTELCHFGRPSLLVPLPTAAANHQEHNARSLENAGAARVVLETEIPKGALEREILRVMTDGNLLKQMSAAAISLDRPEATATICEHILEQAIRYA